MAAPDRRPPRTQPRDALEKLYVYCAGGAILLALGLLVVSFLTTGRMEQLARELADVSDRLSRLEARSGAAAPSERGPAPRPREGQAASRPQRPAPQRTPATQPHSAPAAEADDFSRDRAARMYERAVEEPLGELPRLRDDRAARELLAAADDEPIANLDPMVCRMLALTGRLLRDDDRATRYAERAARLGVDLGDYHELTARQALGMSMPSAALAAVRDLARSPRRASLAALLGAQAFLAQRQPAEARAALAQIGPSAALAVDDRLALCGVQTALEDWSGLATTLGSLGSVPAALTDARDFFRAVALTVSERYAEAVAVLDVLLESQPESYDAHLWRGVALLRARQPEAARQGLARATRIAAGRPEAWYWLGVLEVDEGTSDGAAFFHNALAASTRFAPAWEALATQALNGDELHTATENARRAVESDPGRPSAQFLLAICEARANRRDEAARALKIAFHLDPTLLEQAQRVEAIATLFTPADLAALAPAHATSSAPGDTP